MDTGFVKVERKIELLTVLCICFSCITVGKFKLYIFYRRSPYIFTLTNVFPIINSLLFLHNIKLGPEVKEAHE